ncbi:MAG: hypothetical protein Q7O66_09325 [Dehalococcoidia bacterium]|nr:hypothetical protein [Dehalococcoidia bacterium]
MNPLGIALAFMAFGLVSGLGVFIVGNTVPSLMRSTGISSMGAGTARFTYASLLLLGLAMILAGAFATYKVIYG